MKKLSREISIFLTSGIISNVFSFVIYILFHNLLSYSLSISSVSGQFSALLISYFINSRFGFRRGASFIHKTFYMIYYFSAIFIVSFLIEEISELGIDYRFSWFICISSISILNFLVLKYIVFNKNIRSKK